MNKTFPKPESFAPNLDMVFLIVYLIFKNGSLPGGDVHDDDRNVRGGSGRSSQGVQAQFGASPREKYTCSGVPHSDINVLGQGPRRLTLKRISWKDKTNSSS